MDVKDKIFNYIDAIAAKLGVASEHVYGILVKQQVVSGITYSIVVILLLTFSFIFTIKAYPRYQKEIKDNSDESMWQFLFIISLIFTALMIFISAIALPDCIMQIFNPEYYAIKEIANMFKK